MNRRLVFGGAALALCLVMLLFGAYTYYVDEPGYFYPQRWIVNGGMSAGSGSAPYWAYFYPSGSAISSVAVPDGSADYETRSEIRSFITFIICGRRAVRCGRRLQAKGRTTPWC